jgi:hypothetical protein
MNRRKGNELTIKLLCDAGEKGDLARFQELLKYSTGAEIEGVIPFGEYIYITEAEEILINRAINRNERDEDQYPLALALCKMFGTPPGGFLGQR